MIDHDAEGGGLREQWGNAASERKAIYADHGHLLLNILVDCYSGKYIIKGKFSTMQPFPIISRFDVATFQGAT